MSTILSGVTDLVNVLVGYTPTSGTAVEGIIPQLVDTIADEPLLLLAVVAIPVVGFGIRSLKSLISARV